MNGSIPLYCGPERRVTTDRRTEDRGTPDRRKPGRPRKPATDRVSVRSVKLSAPVDNAICRIALRHGMSVHAVLVAAVKRLVSAEQNYELMISGSQKTFPPSDLS